MSYQNNNIIQLRELETQVMGFQFAPGFHQSSLETVLKVAETLDPNVVTAAMMATAIRAAISAYSIAVTARLSSLNLMARSWISINI